MNHASVLTPTGSSAIAVLGIAGPRAFEVLGTLFRAHRGKPISESKAIPAFWFGTLGDSIGDEVILVRKAAQEFEVHCHGGPRVVDWLLTLLAAQGFSRGTWNDWATPFVDAAAAALLPFARTLRTASILLDQANGAYLRALENQEEERHNLDRYADVGKHLVEPWLVAIAGAPNAGKSTLMNAMAGYTRSVVSPVAGTTRDVVSVALAFDGWPVDLIDTAGLRIAPDELEGEGVRRAQEVISQADLCLWVVDATHPIQPEMALSTRMLTVLNKCDLTEISADSLPEAIRISAATGMGLTTLIDRISSELVPHPPTPGEAVPYR